MSKIKNLLIFLICLLFLSNAYAADSIKFQGAVCDGVTDDTTSLQAALNASQDIYIPINSRCVASNLVIPHDMKLTGIGDSSVLVMKSGSTGILLSTGLHTVILKEFKLDGLSTTDKFLLVAPESDRTALAIAPEFNSRVEKITIDGFGKKGFDLVSSGTVGTAGSHLILTDSTVTKTFNALNIQPQAMTEYIIISDIDMNLNGKGMSIATGNVLISDCILKNNGVGAHVYGYQYANNGHGNISNCLINHSVYNSLWIDRVTVGFNFIGNQIHLGTILINESTGIQIAHGTIQVGEIQFRGIGTNGGRNMLWHNFMFNNAPTAPNTVIHNFQGVNDNSIVQDNYNQTGWFPNSKGALVP